MPEYSALNWYTSDSPGCNVLMSSSIDVCDAWKSIECPIVPSLTSVTVKRSPTLPRRTGPGTCPLNVHICCVTPGATSRTCSLMWKVTSCSVPPGAGARCGSNGFQSEPGFALKSIAAPAGSEFGPACGADGAAASPVTLIFSTMPAALWPGIEQYG